MWNKHVLSWQVCRCYPSIIHLTRDPGARTVLLFVCEMNARTFQVFDKVPQLFEYRATSSIDEKSVFILKSVERGVQSSNAPLETWELRADRVEWCMAHLGEL